MMELKDYEAYLRYELNRSEYTVKVYLSDLKRFLTWQENKENPSLPTQARNMPEEAHSEANPAFIRQKDVRKWLAERAREGSGPRSLRRYASSISAWFHYLQRIGAVKSNPCKELKLPKISYHLPAPADEKEMEQLLATPIPETELTDDFGRWCMIRDRMVVEMLYATGIRRAELHNLNDADISESMQRVQVTGKRNKQRIIPIAPELMQRIAEYRNLRDKLFTPTAPEKQPLFVGNKGSRLNFYAIARIIKEELALTHAAKKTPHTLRHTFATSMLRGGADLRTLKELLGHASLATTQIYTHLSVEELKRNYNLAHPGASKTKF